MVALSLAAAACGSDGDSGAVAAQGADEAATRAVEDATGAVELPADFARAVPTDGIYAGVMLSLGIEPVALASDVKVQLSTVADQLPADVDLDALPEIGLQYEVNLEALAAAEPDLIVASDWEAEESEDVYRRIAPTYFVASGSNGEWRDRFVRIAEALGRGAQGQEVSDRFDDFVDSLPESLSEQTVAFVRASALNDIRADTLETSFAGSVAREAGIPVLDLTDEVDIEPDASWVDLSEENLGLLSEADVIVISDLSFYDPALEPTDTVLAGSALWQSLPAVAAGNVVMVPGPVYNGGHYQAATALLRAISDTVAGS